MHDPFASRIMPFIHPVAFVVPPPMKAALLHCSTVYTPPLQFIIVEPEETVCPPVQTGVFAYAVDLQSIVAPPIVFPVFGIVIMPPHAASP